MNDNMNESQGTPAGAKAIFDQWQQDRKTVHGIPINLPDIDIVPKPVSPIIRTIYDAKLKDGKLIGNPVLSSILPFMKAQYPPGHENLKLIEKCEKLSTAKLKKLLTIEGAEIKPKKKKKALHHRKHDA